MPTLTKTERTKKFRAFVRTVEQSNAAFKRAGQAKRIVMVSKDVLAMLSMGRIRATHGTYVGIKHKCDDCDAETQISDILKIPNLAACDVCAIGAAMVTATLRLNDAKIGANRVPSQYLDMGYTEHSSSSDVASTAASERARSVFPHDLLRLMERAFENGEFGYNVVPEGRRRLSAIYQNLIDNEGCSFTAYRGDVVMWRPWR